MMNSFWSSYEGRINTPIDLKNRCIIPNSFENSKLIQSICSCIRTEETPIFNGEKLDNYKNLIKYEI